MNLQKFCTPTEKFATPLQNFATHDKSKDGQLNSTLKQLICS